MSWASHTCALPAFSPCRNNKKSNSARLISGSKLHHYSRETTRDNNNRPLGMVIAASLAYSACRYGAGQVLIRTYICVTFLFFPFLATATTPLGEKRRTRENTPPRTTFPFYFYLFFFFLSFFVNGSLVHISGRWLAWRTPATWRLRVPGA